MNASEEVGDGDGAGECGVEEGLAFDAFLFDEILQELGSEMDEVL